MVEDHLHQLIDLDHHHHDLLDLDLQQDHLDLLGSTEVDLLLQDPQVSVAQDLHLDLLGLVEVDRQEDPQVLADLAEDEEEVNYESSLYI